MRGAQLFGGAQHGQRQCWITGEDAGPGRGRKGRSNLELGIITPASPVPGIGPAMIEDIFALAMRFDIGGKRRRQLAIAAIDKQGHSLPAAASADTA